MTRDTGLSPLAAAAIVGGALALSGAISRRYRPDPTHRRLFRWYRKLDKPAITPPDPVFGAVWPVLLSGLGYGAWRLLKAEPSAPRDAGVALAGASLALVTLYGKLAFKERNLTAGFIESAALAKTAAAYSYVAAKTDRRAALAGVPLVLWSAFGSWLTRAIARRNPELDSGQRG